MAFAQNTIIYQDDFEGAVTGWSINNTDFDPDVTRFLGRFDNNPTSTSRTFTVPPNTSQVIIEFDFYRFDSWDDSAQFGFDRFQIDVDGVQIFSLPMPNPQPARSGTSGNVDWSHTPLTGRVELAFNTGQFWFDQLHRVVIVVNNPGPTVDLTLRTAINQGGNDESGGYDNFLVTAVPIPNPSFSVEKVAANNGPFGAGDTINYTYTITNDGNQVISNVRLTDAHNGSDPPPVPGNETLVFDAAPLGDSTDGTSNGVWDVLSPGDIVSFTGQYTVTQSDVDTLQ